MPWTLPPFTAKPTSLAAVRAHWGLELLEVSDCWSRSQGAGVRIAVLDTGADLSHPELAGAVAEAADFTASPSDAPFDVVGHGSWCAGCIAARNHNGLFGVAPAASLLVGKVLDNRGQGNSRGIVDGLRWATTKKADIISMSLGSPEPDPAIHAEIQRAVAAGIILVCAAGNDGPAGNTLDYPGKWPESFSVGAVDRYRKVGVFSSRGRELLIVAPGVDCLGLWPGGRFSSLSGTSMATPFIAGCLALALSYLRSLPGKPRPSSAELLSILETTAIDLEQPGRDENTGFGLVSPVALLDYLTPAAPLPPPVLPPVTPTPGVPPVDTSILKSVVDALFAAIEDYAAKKLSPMMAGFVISALKMLNQLVDDQLLKSFGAKVAAVGLKVEPASGTVAQWVATAKSRTGGVI